MGNHVPGGMMATVKNGTEPGLQSDPLFTRYEASKRNAWAIIVAAGSGSRLAESLGAEPKQFFIFKNRPLYWHSAQILARCACVKGLIFVFPETYLCREEERLAALEKSDNLGLPFLLAKGGKSRSESSRNGLRLLPACCTEVFIHDAARPFLKADLVWRLYNSMRPDLAGVIPGLRITDTVKLVDENELILNTPPRSSLRAVQTPQLFNTRILKNLYTDSFFISEQITDDAASLEKAGFKIQVVEGDPNNVKITTPLDLKLLHETDFAMLPCTGFGYDVHRYGEGHPLKLGGVSIPSSFKVVAHSDGDVLLHALTDAILGCASLGDIGNHFPDSDSAYANMNSALFVEHALSLLRAKEIKLTHIDITLVAQKPKLQAYKAEIAKNIARLCSLDSSQVNIKATTEEGMGFTGHLEGIKAYAVVSALKKA